MSTPQVQPALLHDIDNSLALNHSNELTPLDLEPAIRAQYKLPSTTSLYYFEMPDDTMMPALRGGDIVIVDRPLEKLRDRVEDGLYCVGVGKGITVRRFKALEHEQLLITCDQPGNPNFIRSVQAFRNAPFCAPVRLVVRRDSSHHEVMARSV
jgi:hypothetical protein